MLKIYNNNEILKPKAIIFDTDNTLYSYETAHYSAFKAVMQKAEDILGVNNQDFQEVFDLSRKEIKLQLGDTASSHSRLLYFQRVVEKLGMGTRIFLTLDLEQTYWREFLTNAELFPNVKEFLQQLKSIGIKTANITDLTAQIQFRKMVYFGLDEYFDYVVTSEEAGCDKPNIQPYEMAFKKLNIDSKFIWMIGDNPKSDIYGAKKSSDITALQKIHKGVNIGRGECAPDISFNHYSELINLISGLLKS